jgi:nicotinamidase/pyrazinamidase
MPEQSSSEQSSSEQGSEQSGARAARALIVVDVQRDFCEGGSLAVAGGAEVAARISELLSGDHGYAAVLATRDHHIDPGDHFAAQPDFVESWPAHCVVGTGGVEFHEELRFRDFDAIFDKGEYAAAYSGFEGKAADGSTLADWLRTRGIASVDVCGIATDYCVRATALDAAREGFDTTVLVDLTAAVAPDRVPAVREEWQIAGIDVSAG